MGYDDEYDYLEEDYMELDGKQKRDKRAKALRSDGYTVQIESHPPHYRVFAERRKQR